MYRSIVLTVGELRFILENTVSCINDAGFAKIDPTMPDKLSKLAVLAGEADMKEGKRLIENLANTMRAILEGESTPESGNVRLTALDFYVQKLDAGVKNEGL